MRDLNLDQAAAVVAGNREERDLITAVLSSPLRDAGTVRYRQDVFRATARTLSRGSAIASASGATGSR